MLRRTRARQVAPVYEKFIREYPSAVDLYRADPAEVREHLTSLGLDWRIKQFESLARQLVEEFGGRVPETREDLMRITGVSDYVADAVLVFGFGRPRAVVDANVARVITRHFGLREHAEARRDKEVVRLASELLDRQRPREYNFALLDLAATVCTPSNPKHDVCPLSRTCTRAKGDCR